MRAGGVDVEWLMLAVRDAGGGRRRATPCPSGCRPASRARVISPTAPACVPQDHLEPVLLAHAARARRAGRARRRGRRRRGRAPTASGRRCATSRPGASATVRARYLIAADGAHSRCARRSASRCPGPTALGEAVSAVFRRAALAARSASTATASTPSTIPMRAASSCPPGRNDRWLYGVVWSPRRGRRRGYDAEWLTRRIRRGRAPPTCRSRSSASGASRSPPSWPTGSARAAHSWSATPPTGSPPAAAPA